MNHRGSGSDRRAFLRATLAAGAGAIIGPGASGALLRSPALERQPASCILINLAGGVPQTDTWDPKEYTPMRRGMPMRSLLGTSRSIPTAIPGVRFAEGLDEIASIMDRGCVVRSLVPDEAAAIAAPGENWEGTTGEPNCVPNRAPRRAPLPLPTHESGHLALQGIFGRVPSASGVAGPDALPRLSATSGCEQFSRALDAALWRACAALCIQRIDTAFEPFAGFDTHDFGARRVARLKQAIDRPIADLVRGLEARGVLDRTLVVVVSEFGRTIGPSRGFASCGQPGDRAWIAAATVEDESMYGFHGHFAECTSALLFGGRVRRGFAWGRSADAHPMVAVADPVPWSSWQATLRVALGLSGGERPRGEPVRALLKACEGDA